MAKILVKYELLQQEIIHLKFMFNQLEALLYVATERLKFLLMVPYQWKPFLLKQAIGQDFRAIEIVYPYIIHQEKSNILM